jgi:4-hydroxybenzoate polyprenyltransferase
MDAVIRPDIATAKATLREWLGALRLHQWSKNLLIFVPLILGHYYGSADAILKTALAFLALGLVASGTYLINDLTDIDADRQHRTKRQRAIARGAISPQAALAAAAGLIAAGFGAGAAVSGPLALLLSVYLATTLCYSASLTRVALLDVVTLGALYTLRIMMGAAALRIDDSPWLLMFSLFFFLSLALAKRHVEIVPAAGKLPPGTQVGGRGYYIGDEPLTFGFGLSTGVTAIVILILYVANDAWPIGAYAHPRFLWLIAPVLPLWIMRIWLLRRMPAGMFRAGYPRWRDFAALIDPALSPNFWRRVSA